jgi:hypothetical protein
MLDLVFQRVEYVTHWFRKHMEFFTIEKGLIHLIVTKLGFYYILSALGNFA